MKTPLIQQRSSLFLLCLPLVTFVKGPSISMRVDTNSGPLRKAGWWSWAELPSEGSLSRAVHQSPGFALPVSKKIFPFQLFRNLQLPVGNLYLLQKLYVGQSQVGNQSDQGHQSKVKGRLTWDVFKWQSTEILGIINDVFRLARPILSLDQDFKL